MSVRTFVFEEGGWKAIRKPKGSRKPEWNGENRKTANKIYRRQTDYDNMIASPGFKNRNVAGYHRPGSGK